MSRAEREERQAQAEKVQRRANRKITLFSILFVLWQVSYFTFLPDMDERVRSVDVVRTLGFLVWVIALLALFATGGAIFGRRQLRPFLNDERAVAVRAAAYRAGFWTMIVLCIAGYVATLLLTLRAVDVVHVVLSGGVLAVLTTQIVLDRG